jgi:hypothetical protein
MLWFLESIPYCKILRDDNPAPGSLHTGLRMTACINSTSSERKRTIKAVTTAICFSSIALMRVAKTLVFQFRRGQYIITSSLRSLTVFSSSHFAKYALNDWVSPQRLGTREKPGPSRLKPEQHYLFFCLLFVAIKAHFLSLRERGPFLRSVVDNNATDGPLLLRTGLTTRVSCSERERAFFTLGHLRIKVTSPVVFKVHADPD